jgi:glycosyltransferase involved in cell wall biosynthesis
MTKASSDAPLKLLALGPQPVWPPTDGGREGIHGALEALARQAEVTYACPCSSPEPESIVHFNSLGIDYRPVKYQPDDSIGNIIASTLQMKPFKFHKYGNSQAFRAFSKMLAGVETDVILCFHAHMFELGQRLRYSFGWNVPILLREHNIEYELVESYRASLALPKQIAAAPFSWFTRRAELRAWGKADGTLFLSDRDFDVAKASGRTANAVLAREGVPIPVPRDLTQSTLSKSLLLPLNPKATQSLGNVRKFLHEYWTFFVASGDVSDISLTITGVDSKTFTDLTGISFADQKFLRINAVGFLSEFGAVFDSVTAVLSPTFVGGGIRKKMLEGMANQLPVIATDHDIQTCRFLKASDNIIRLGSPADLVKNARLLVDDREYWQKLSVNGRATVESYASWDGFADTVLFEARRLRKSRGRASS